MTIILDFDDVLFDAANFKKALAKIFKKHRADFFRDYKRAKKPQGVYSLEKHLILLKKEENIDINKVKKDTEKLFKNLKQFLFTDSLRFLENYKKHNLILLSLGDRRFQKKKIYGLGKKFVSFFDEIVITSSKKSLFVKKIINKYKERPIIFISDKIEELEEIKTKFKDIKCKLSL